MTAFSLVFLLFLLPSGADFSFPSLLPGIEEGEAVSGEAYEETVKRETLAAVKADLCRRFSIGKDALALSGEITLDGEDFAIRSLTLTLSGTGFFADASSLLRYVEENYTTHCEVHFVGS
ncbi:MAG: hypothetical protein IJV96_00325 [Clostridia bacterium]|nr:hypothetical protein [Clostridia bacterium]